jgi:hypothetical protein
LLSPNAGYFPYIVQQRSDFFDLTFLEVLRSYTQIASVTLMPDCDGPDSFNDVLSVLGDLPSLLRLNVNAFCMDEHNASVLANIDGLRELELSDPTLAIFNLLPEWLNRLSKSLVALHLTVKLQALRQNLAV